MRASGGRGPGAELGLAEHRLLDGERAVPRTTSPHQYIHTSIHPQHERIHAPDLVGRLLVQRPAPLTLKDLRGKVVLLDFWTYGCINCMHVLPDFDGSRRSIATSSSSSACTRRSSRTSGGPRTSAGSSSATTSIIRWPTTRISRSGKAYGARAWPTLVLIDPEGYVVATASGKARATRSTWRSPPSFSSSTSRAKIDRRPIALSLERERLKTSTLAFPGKVLADEAPAGCSSPTRTTIACSSHARRPGPGRREAAAGRADGTFERRAFLSAAGARARRRTLYIADTENHLVVRWICRRRVTRSPARAGRRVGRAGRRGGRDAAEFAVGLAVVGRLLFVAMAGAHQIWMVDLERPLAFRTPDPDAKRASTGDRRRRVRAALRPGHRRRDALRGGQRSQHHPRDRPAARQSGADHRRRRPVRIRRHGRPGDAARFQHPLGRRWARRLLFIADTYNHKIKVLDPATGE